MAKSKKDESAQLLMYVGKHRADPIPLSRGTVFTSLPPSLQKAMAKDKTLAALFVPLSEAGKALRVAARSEK